MALGRAYGDYGYGDGVFGQELIIDATSTIASTSGATANASIVYSVSAASSASCSMGAAATATYNAQLTAISASSGGAAANDTEIAFANMQASSTATATATATAKKPAKKDISTQAIPPYLDDLADVGAWLLQELELLAEEADCFVLVGLQGGRKKR